MGLNQSSSSSDSKAVQSSKPLFGSCWFELVKLKLSISIQLPAIGDCAVDEAITTTTESGVKKKEGISKARYVKFNDSPSIGIVTILTGIPSHVKK